MIGFFEISTMCISSITATRRVAGDYLRRHMYIVKSNDHLRDIREDAPNKLAKWCSSESLEKVLHGGSIGGSSKGSKDGRGYGCRSGSHQRKKVSGPQSNHLGEKMRTLMISQ